MCYMAFYPPGAKPRRKHLASAAQLNPDSAGWALVRPDGGTFIWDRGLDAGQMISEFLDRRDDFRHWHALFHARHATGGMVDELNAHPVPATMDPLDNRIVVAHNGYLFPVDGDESDTVIFTRQILPLYDLDNPAERALLNKRMGPNKAIIFSASPSLDLPVYILNKRMGITGPDGTWHSNEDYLGKPHRRPGWCTPCGVQLSDDHNVICRRCLTAASDRRAVLLDPPGRFRFPSAPGGLDLEEASA